MRTPYSRRQFVQGLALGGAAASLGIWPHSARAWEDGPSGPALIEGTSFDLRISETPVNLTGAPRTALTIHDSLPAPTLNQVWLNVVSWR